MAKTDTEARRHEASGSTAPKGGNGSGGFGAPDSTIATLAIAALVALGISGLVNWSAGRKPWQATVPGQTQTHATQTATPSGSPAPSTTPTTTSALATPAAPTPAAPTTAGGDGRKATSTADGKPAAATAPSAASGASTAAAGGTMPIWAASATGRIEPRDGEVRLVTGLPGRVLEVLVKANDQVFKGDLLVRLDDEDALLKVTAANSEADVRKRERDEEQASGLASERRKAEDASADADRDLFRARLAFDAVTTRLRAGKATADELSAATKKLLAADERAAQEKAKLTQTLAKPGMPLPTRLESAVTSARTEISGAEAMVEKLRLRAPYDGVALAVAAKAGEYAVPSPEASMVTFGDIGSLRVRAEVEERDATKVRLGQPVVVRADAFPDREFTGVVTSVAKALGAPRMTARGPRRPNDVEVLEVQASLDGTPPLLTGMRVDVYFKLDPASAAAPAKAK